MKLRWKQLKKFKINIKSYSEAIPGSIPNDNIFVIYKIK